MNHRNIKKLITRLKKTTPTPSDETGTVKLGFNMEDFTHECGTPACIAGWATSMSRNQNEFANRGAINFSSEAAAWMGLDFDWCTSHLFYPHAWENWEAIEPKHAVKALENILKAGECYTELHGAKLWGMTDRRIEQAEARWLKKREKAIQKERAAREAEWDEL